MFIAHVHKKHHLPPVASSVEGHLIVSLAAFGVQHINCRNMHTAECFACALILRTSARVGRVWRKALRCLWVCLSNVGACERRWLGKDQWSWRVVAGQNAAYGAPDHSNCKFTYS